jgi:hypothetical protein
MVIDLGLREVGVKSDRRRLAGRLALSFAALYPLLFVSLVVRCVSGGGSWLAVVSSLAWMGGAVALAWRAARRGPVLVVRITADRRHGALPKVLRRVRTLLEPGEQVLGDGIGRASGTKQRRDGLRLVVATDRRLVITNWAPASEDFVLIDAPYAEVARVDFAWQRVRRTGVLRLTVAGATHAIAMAPANLLSIVDALAAHGVRPDDPVALAEAQRAWDERRRAATRPGPRRLDRAAMTTRAFDRGLWLFAGAAAVMFYMNPFGVGIGGTRNGAVLFALVPVLGAVCGRVSGTRSSLAYLAPLNLLIVPAFFFADAGDVVIFMIMLSALGGLGLWAGSSVRHGAAGRAAARPSPRTLSGARLVRLSAATLAVAVGLVAVAGAAGVPLSNLRLAIYEKSAKHVPVDGRSNLTGGAASISYTPVPGLRELITDEYWGGGPNDGARWELRSSYRKGYNVVSLAHYVFAPALDDPAAITAFLADKDREHARLAGAPVHHTERVVDGRRGYVWQHRDRHGHWYFAAWFPQPVHTVRVECIAYEEITTFRLLCGEAMRSLTFHSSVAMTR